MTMQKKQRKNQWKQQSVCFLVADCYHNLKPVNITMPVRVKERTEDRTVYEGPIEAMWEKKVSPRVNASSVSKHLHQYDLVGVLVACLDVLDRGQINWMEQSGIDTGEAGADHIKNVA